MSLRCDICGVEIGSGADLEGRGGTEIWTYVDKGDPSGELKTRCREHLRDK